MHCYKHHSGLIFVTVGKALTISNVLDNVSDVKKTFVDGSKKIELA